MQQFIAKYQGTYSITFGTDRVASNSITIIAIFTVYPWQGGRIKERPVITKTDFHAPETSSYAQSLFLV